MLNLSLSGCGFLGIYHIGVISAFREHAPEIIQNKISGCSAGSLVAACALCDCCLGQMVSDVLEIALKSRSYSLGPLHPSFSIVEILRNGLRRILPVDAHKICSGRLNVSLTKWKDGSNWLVNTFDTREDLIQALICSSFVPLYSGLLPPKYKGVYCWDGGLSNNNPIIDQHTIVVSPFGGESDICPREESASFYCFDLQGTNIQWSKENFYRLSKAFFPPSPQVLKGICFRGYKDAISFLKSRNLLQCSCQQRLIRDKSTIQNLVGEDFPFNDYQYDDEIDDLDDNNKNRINDEIESITDSDVDHVEQYAQSAVEPLKYQEMPKPVCDILDAACADHKETLINHLYNSKISRAISIVFLPWTLPIEMSFTFTKKLIDYLPKINVPNDSKNLTDNLLFYLNLIIQKFTYDKYQYHARVTCKLCVLKAHQIDSNVGGLKFSLCYHTGTQSSITNYHEHDDHKHHDESTSKELTLANNNNYNNNHHHNHHHHQSNKLCPRHRLPSTCYSSSSENTNSIITSSTTTTTTTTPSAQQQQKHNIKRRKYFSSVNLQKQLLASPSSSLYSNSTAHDFQSTSLTNKYFDKARTEKKLRRYKFYNNNNKNIENKVSSVAIDIRKNKNLMLNSSYEDGSILNKDETDSDSFDDYEHVNYSKRRLYQVNNNNINDDQHNSKKKINDNTVVDEVKIERNKALITTINEINEMNFEFLFNDDDKDDENLIENRCIVNNNNNNNNNNNDNNQIDLESYLDKLELNILGKIDN